MSVHRMFPAIAALTGALLLFAPGASSSLLGDSVRACWTTVAQLASCTSGGFNAFTQPGASGDTQTVVEGDSAITGEFRGALAGPLPAQDNTLEAFLDVDSGSFIAALDNALTFGPIAQTVLLLWDLDWLDGGSVVPAVIEGVTVGFNNLGVTPGIQFGHDATLGNAILVTFPAGIRILDGSVSAEFLIEVRHIPEPGTLALFGLGLTGFGALRRRKAQAA